MYHERPYTFDRTVRLLIAIAVLVVLFLLTKRLSGVLLPFLVSWFIAYMIHPVVKFFQYTCRLKHRVLAVMVTLLGLLIVFVGILAVLIPLVSKEFGKLSDLISMYMNGKSALSFLPETWQVWFRTFVSQLDVITLLHDENLMAALKRLLPKLWSIVDSSISFVMGIAVVFICLLYLVFILIDFEKISQGWSDFIPPKYKPLLMDIVHDLETGMNRYFRGQALVALSVGILFAIGFCITGLPLAIVIGLFLGLLNMVPYLQTIGVLPCVLLGLLQAMETGTNFWLVMLGIAIVFIVVQCIQDFFLVPKIMGNVTGMNPALILLALCVWGSLLGIAGMIIALPITTLLISYYKRLVLHEGGFGSSETNASPDAETQKIEEA